MFYFIVVFHHATPSRCTWEHAETNGALGLSAHPAIWLP
jgi:hypothetical protein